VYSQSWHFVIADEYADAAVESLRPHGRVSILAQLDPDRRCEALRTADALLVRTRFRVTEDILVQSPRLKVIARAGVGLDNVDVAAARLRNVAVLYTPAASTDAVADLTIGLIIALVRGIVTGDHGVRVGQFAPMRSALVGRELSELTLGIVGLGRIGSAVARRACLGFGMRVIYNDLEPKSVAGLSLESADKEEIWRTADVISLHVPLTDSTRQMIDADVLRRIKSGALLVNTARGACVDGMALASALREGRLGGAGLDVTDPEPLPSGHPLLLAPHAIFTPHLGARTVSSLARMESVAGDVVNYLTGRPLIHGCLARGG